MFDFVVYKIKGKFLRLNLLFRLREIKKNFLRNMIFKGIDFFVINWEMEIEYMQWGCNKNLL